MWIFQNAFSVDYLPLFPIHPALQPPPRLILPVLLSFFPSLIHCVLSLFPWKIPNLLWLLTTFLTSTGIPHKRHISKNSNLTPTYERKHAVCFSGSVLPHSGWLFPAPSITCKFHKFIFLHDGIIPHCVSRPHFCYLFIGWWALGHFQLLAIVTGTVVSMKKYLCNRSRVLWLYEPGWLLWWIYF